MVIGTYTYTHTRTHIDRDRTVAANSMTLVSQTNEQLRLPAHWASSIGGRVEVCCVYCVCMCGGVCVARPQRQQRLARVLWSGMLTRS